MGFSIFWKIFDDWEEKILNTLVTPNSVLIIDFNNFVATIVSEFGGHYQLLQERCNLLFNAVKSSGFKIHIVKDGYVDGERAIIKLNRIQQALFEDVASKIENYFIETRQNHISISFECANLIFGKKTSDDEMITFTYAEGEADPIIRQIAKSKLSEGYNVYVLSGDASLIIGLGSTNISIINPLNCHIHLETKQIICTPIHLPDFLSRINQKTNEILHQIDSNINNIKELASYDLCLVVSLLENERKTIVDAKQNPLRLLQMVRNYLWDYDNEYITNDNLIPSRSKYNNAITAMILIRLWISTTEGAMKTVNLENGVLIEENFFESLIQGVSNIKVWFSLFWI